MYVGEESHRGIVPMNPSNQGGRSPAEKEEGRLRHKENTPRLARTRLSAGPACPRGSWVCGPFGRSLSE
jgi:hypothetical protein